FGQYINAEQIPRLVKAVLNAAASSGRMVRKVSCGSTGRSPYRCACCSPREVRMTKKPARAPDKLKRIGAAVRSVFGGRDEPVQQHTMLEGEYAYLDGGKLPADYSSSETNPRKRLASIHAALHA